MPVDNQLSDAKVELGKLLFFDRRMSGNNLVSCAACHVATQGWGDGNELSLGYPGTLHWRNSQTIINSVYQAKFFWAGEKTSLEAQAKSAWTGNLAQNLDTMMAEEKMAQIPEYVQLFNDAFGASSPSFDDALRAVAAFEATITSQNVPFDNYMRGDLSAMSESALRGAELYAGKANCIQCHSGPLFADQSFHNIGVPRNSEFETNELRQIALRYQHRARGVPEEIYRSADRDLGLYYTTKQDEDKGKFRTPPLREVGQTGPYMHNGVFSTLIEVVEFYNEGGGDDSKMDPLIAPLGLTPEEIADVVAFLESLTGDEIIVETPPMPEYAVMAP
jgi:cytochrome c peroxidase